MCLWNKMPWFILLLGAILWMMGCSPSVVKKEAFDKDVLSRRSLPSAYLSAANGGELIIKPGTHWLGDVDPKTHLTFAGFRMGENTVRYCILLECVPATDSLVLLPLEKGETPLTVLNDSSRRTELRKSVTLWQKGLLTDESLIETSLKEVVKNRLLGSPLPNPKHVYAVAANYPSHLKYDLAVANIEDKLGLLKKARPRVFLKFPPVPPPDSVGHQASPDRSLLGPYDPLKYLQTIEVPGETGTQKVAAHLDYEVEIGVVIGTRLTWEDIRDKTDEEVMEKIAGYVLVSDAKLRDPQVVQNVVNLDRNPRPENTYIIGDRELDTVLGIWNRETCHWWSYAAGWGRYASVGPFFVAVKPGAEFPERAMIGGRSYAPADIRGLPLPENHNSGTVYLRQVSVTTTRYDYPDALIWNLPRILRSILNPEGNALGFMSSPPSLEPGDIVSLGTPGGAVITAKPWWVSRLAENLLFWKKPVDFHRMFFGPMEGNYLLPGDRIFLWTEGLGYQELEVEHIQP